MAPVLPFVIYWDWRMDMWQIIGVGPKKSRHATCGKTTMANYETLNSWLYDAELT